MSSVYEVFLAGLITDWISTRGWDGFSMLIFVVIQLVLQVLMFLPLAGSYGAVDMLAEVEAHGMDSDSDGYVPRGGEMLSPGILLLLLVWLVKELVLAQAEMQFWKIVKICCNDSAVEAFGDGSDSANCDIGLQDVLSLSSEKVEEKCGLATVGSQEMKDVSKMEAEPLIVNEIAAKQDINKQRKLYEMRLTSSIGAYGEIISDTIECLACSTVAATALFMNAYTMDFSMYLTALCPLLLLVLLVHLACFILLGRVIKVPYGVYTSAAAAAVKEGEVEREVGSVNTDQSQAVGEGVGIISSLWGKVTSTAIRLKQGLGHFWRARIARHCLFQSIIVLLYFYTVSYPLGISPLCDLLLSLVLC